jgi:hypothetical protein
VDKGKASADRYRLSGADGHFNPIIRQRIPDAVKHFIRDMGTLNWRCVVANHHPLTGVSQIDDDTLRSWPSLVQRIPDAVKHFITDVQLHVGEMAVKIFD